MVSNLAKGWLRLFGVGLCALITVLTLTAAAAPAHAQQSGREFNIQVSPAILPVVLKPGVQKTVAVTVRNLSNHTETLTPRLSGFRSDALSHKIELESEPPANMTAWVIFKQSELVLQPGESKPLEIIYDTPANVGFSYTTAITLSRSSDEQTVGAPGASLKGAVAIFNLINIDRPDAKRHLSIESFTSKRGTYEFLPASFDLTIKNTGNIIEQPAGNIFIQRSFSDDMPLATIPVNAGGSYVLPGSARTITASWEDGFPAYGSETTSEKTTDMHLTWNWKNANQLRFGRYVAKAVVIYNDGQRDMPVITSVTFWVIPWRIIFISLLLITVLGMGLFGWGRVIARGTKKVRRYAARK